ncbi:MAG: PilN domain-containing protein [Neisseria sp.]|nr:PilN domain-containing protein [Neisseria sp.]
MINLIKVNLLPYREEIRRKKQQQFKALMLVALAVGVGLAVFAYLGIEQAISAQESRNQFLDTEIKKLDKEIEEISKLESERDAFLLRKQKVEELQNKRFEGAHIIDSLNELLPEGVYLTALTAKDEKNYEISGRAVSDNRIAMFMNVLPSKGLFDIPELASIKKNDTSQDFTIKTKVDSSLKPLVAANAPLVEQGASAPAAGQANNEAASGVDAGAASQAK